MSRKFTLLLAFFSALIIQGQDLDYFAELSNPLAFGDSRSNAMAGNMIAMSGSLTALAHNPATAGLYRKDVFSFDANSFGSRNVNSTGGTIGNSANLNIGSAGFLARNPNDGWHFFFTYNTEQMYRARVRNNQANSGSMINQFINNAAGTLPDGLEVNVGVYEHMIYQSYGIDYNSNTGEYYSSANLNDVDTRHLYFRKGLKNRWTAGAGKGISQRLYVGGALSIMHSFESVEVEHYEIFNETSDLIQFDMEEWWKNSAIGITGNIGLYYRPIQSVRFAAAIELPSILGFTQEWETKFIINRPSVPSEFTSQIGLGEDYQWSMLTAPKLSSGITFVAGRVGLFTVNYAYIPTGVGRMISEYERYLNNAIDSLLTTTHRLGAAGEIRLGVLTICGGATYINSAQESLGPQIQTGLGASIRSGNTTYFFSYGQIIRDKQYYMYSADYSNAVSYSNSLSVLSTGVTVKF